MTTFQKEYQQIQRTLAGLSQYSGQRSELEAQAAQVLADAKREAEETLRQIAEIEAQANREAFWAQAKVVACNTAAVAGDCRLRPVVTVQDTMTFQLLMRHWLKIVDAFVSFTQPRKLAVESHVAEDMQYVTVTVRKAVGA